MLVNMSAIPVLYITAENNYEVGKAIGSTFRGFIDDYIQTSEDVQLFRKFYVTSEGRAIYEDYLNSSQQCFPEIVDEIGGIADGANQTFEDVFMLQIASEILISHQHEIAELTTKQPVADKGCTDILINTNEFRMIAHNDDWSNEVSERVYIGHVTITNKDGDIQERFLSYMYPGYLSGFCFGMNKDLVITLNTVSPVTANRKGVPLLILLRKLLTCGSIDECAAMMENKPLGCAFGMNINIAHVNDDTMCSMEVYPEESRSRVDIMPIKNSQYCHTNHYKHTASTAERPSTGGTFRRNERAAEMMSHPLSSMDDVRKLLGDTKDQLEPIYRIPSEKYLSPDSKTSATALFNLQERRMDVYRSNPKSPNMPCFTTAFL